jgi:hypothetical protein
MGVSVSCEIGTTLGGLATLTSLGISSPLASYRPQSEIVKMAGGNVVRRGFPTARWEWKYLSQAEIDILRTYCTGGSASIFIATPINDGRAYDDFEGVMVWPEDETGTNFILDFTHLVAA